MDALRNITKAKQVHCIYNHEEDEESSCKKTVYDTKNVHMARWSHSFKVWTGAGEHLVTKSM